MSHPASITPIAWARRARTKARRLYARTVRRFDPFEGPTPDRMYEFPARRPQK